MTKELGICEWCDTDILEDVIEKHFESPWDEVGKVQHYCSEECRDRSEDSSYCDYAYLYCSSCERNIIARCPSNGWHEYFIYEADYGLYCLKCWQDNALENGISEEKFEKGIISGSFFSEDKLIKAGYKEIESAFIGSISDSKRYCARALKLIGKGFKVLNNYERMAIGGLEGTISLWAKK